jgi:hypothetical protein
MVSFGAVSDFANNLEVNFDRPIPPMIVARPNFSPLLRKLRLVLLLLSFIIN